MFQNCKTTTEQGNIGEAYAIAYYTKIGWKISKPLFVNTDYDLVVDNGTELLKVQIKTTRQRTKTILSSFIVNIKSSGSNARVTDIRDFDNTKVNILFVLANNGDCWSIPVEGFVAKTAITLSNGMDKYKVVL